MKSLIGYPHGGKKIGTFAAHRAAACSADLDGRREQPVGEFSGKRYQIGEIGAPEVLYAVRQQQDALRP
jgi:hypothetical protein